MCSVHGAACGKMHRVSVPLGDEYEAHIFDHVTKSSPRGHVLTTSAALVTPSIAWQAGERDTVHLEEAALIAARWRAAVAPVGARALALRGARVEVYWPEDDEWYECTVTSVEDDETGRRTP